MLRSGIVVEVPGSSVVRWSVRNASKPSGKLGSVGDGVMVLPPCRSAVMPTVPSEVVATWHGTPVLLVSTIVEASGSSVWATILSPSLIGRPVAGGVPDGPSVAGVDGPGDGAALIGVAGTVAVATETPATAARTVAAAAGVGRPI